jgi:hypothetical protein
MLPPEDMPGVDVFVPTYSGELTMCMFAVMSATVANSEHVVEPGAQLAEAAYSVLAIASLALLSTLLSLTASLCCCCCCQ